MIRRLCLTILSLVLLFGCRDDPRQDVFGGDYSDCRNGNVDACYRHGQSREVGTAESRRSALVAYQYACLLDHSPSCGRLALFYGKADLSDERTVENLTKACDGGDGEACNEIAQRHPDRSAIKLYQKACDAGVGAGCEGAAVILRKQHRLVRSLEEAQHLSERACELDHAPGCIAAGQALLFGSGIDPDSKRGLEMLEKTCTEEVGDGCLVLARIYQDGLGVDADPEQADAYYEMAELHVDEPVASDPASAFVVYVNACNFGDELGCFNAAWFLATGSDVRRNVSTARELYKRACDSGVARSCDEWRKMQPPREVRRSEAK